MAPVVRGNLRDRNKSGMIAYDNSTQRIIWWGSRIGDGIYQKKIKSGWRSRIYSKNSARKQYTLSTNSQSDSLHTGTEWIIHSTRCSILSVKGGWIFSISCSWFQWVFDIGWYGKSYRKLALQFHPEKNKHPRASSVMRMINEAK